MFSFIGSRLGLLSLVLALCAVIALGWYISTLRGTIASLRASVSLLEVEVMVRDEKMLRDTELLKGVQEELSGVRSEAKSLRDKVQKELESDAEAKDWGSTALPSSIQRLLNSD